jgi:hypothetical protein
MRVMDPLLRIKRLVLRGWIRFTEKARHEMEADGLSAGDVIESIVNAQAVSKTLRSRSRVKRYAGEKLYVIKSFNYEGTLIYTKGAIVRQAGREVFYVFVSAKVATLGE